MRMQAVIRTGYEAETRDPARTGLKPAGDGKMWWDDRFRPPLCQAGLGSFSAVMASLAGECLRALEDRENWHLELGGPDEQPYGVYLKKHHVRTWRSRLRAKLGVGPGETAGRIEAQNVGSLTADGIGVMNLVAYGEKLHRNGLVESFVLTEELEGYTELSQFILRRFPAGICDLGFGIWDLGFGEAQSSTLFSQPSTLNSQPSTLNSQPSTLSRRMALMCGEEDPTNCHRRLLVGRVLRGRGVEVMHIRAAGRVQSEEEVAAEETFRKTKGQLTLFDMEEPDAWKSTRSVLPRKAPPSSSESSSEPGSDG